MSAAYNNVHTSPIELVLSRVKHKKSNKGYMANCPAHDDQKPSLSVTEDSNGAVGITCFAGCNKDAVLQAMGLQMSDLFPKTQKQESKKPKNIKVKPTLTSFAKEKCLTIEFLKSAGVQEINQGLAFLYLNVEGELARTKIRTGTAHDGYWDKTYSDKPIVPYGLPIFLQLTRQTGVGHLVEGESDTLTGILYGMGILGIPGARMTGILVSSYLEGLNTLYLHQEPDEAGTTFIIDLEKKLKSFNYQGKAFVIQYPGNGVKDLNDLHCYCHKNNLDFKVEFQKYLDQAALLDLTNETAIGSEDEDVDPENYNSEQNEENDKEYSEDDNDEDSSPNHSQSNNKVKNNKGYYIGIGDYVHADDRANYGKVLAVNGTVAVVHFKNKQTGHSANASLPIDSLTPTGSNSIETSYNPTSTTPVKWPTPLGQAAYHGLVGQILRIIEPHTEADVAALLFQLLTALGNLIGRKPYFFAESTKHFPVLFALIVGGTNSGKGSSLAQIKRLLTPIDEEWKKKLGPGLSSGEGILYEVRDKTTKKQKDKDTGEMAEVVVDEGIEDKRILITQTEFASVFKVANRDGNTLADVLRQIFDCEEFLKVRTKNSPINASGAHISVIGQITPEELRKLMTETDAFNGFLNRFLWASVRQSKSLPDGGDLKEEDLHPLRTKIKQAINRIQDEKIFTRDAEARALWHEHYPAITAERPGFIGALIKRARALIMRVALIYAVMDGADIIRREHLQAGFEIWRYCVESVECIFSDRAGDAMAEKILAELRKQKEMPRKDITALFNNNAKKEDIDHARDALVRLGLIEIEKRNTAKVGKSSEIWILVGAKQPTDPPDETNNNIVKENDVINDVINFDQKQDEKYRRLSKENNNIVNKIVITSFSENSVTNNEINNLDNNIVNIVNIVEGVTAQSSSNPNEIKDDSDNLSFPYDINDINDINLGVEKTPINPQDTTQEKTVNEVSSIEIVRNVPAIESSILVPSNIECSGNSFPFIHTKHVESEMGRGGTSGASGVAAGATSVGVHSSPSNLADSTSRMPNELPFSSITTSSMFSVPTLQKSLTAIKAVIDNPKFKAHKMYLRCNQILKELNESDGMIDNLLATDIMRTVNQVSDLA